MLHDVPVPEEHASTNVVFQRNKFSNIANWHFLHLRVHCIRIYMYTLGNNKAFLINCENINLILADTFPLKCSHHASEKLWYSHEYRSICR